MKLLVIIPAFNEEKNISKVITELKRDMDFADILVINDCSKDGTLEVLKNISGISYLSVPFNLGYSSVVQTGFKYARDKGYDFIVQFDGDGQHIVTEAVKMYDVAQKSGADIVIGSRFMSNTEYKHSFFRKIGTTLFVWLIKLICGVRITDPTSGLQVLNRKVFTCYADMYGYPEYPDANLLIEMLLRGFKIIEVEVKMRQREFGVSMHSGIIKPVKYMIKMLYAILLIIIRWGDFTHNGRIKGE